MRDELLAIIEKNSRIDLKELAIILGVVLLGEPLSMKLVMGSLLILSGVLVLAL